MVPWRRQSIGGAGICRVLDIGLIGVRSHRLDYTEKACTQHEDETYLQL
jgi:hypothetical protein